MRPYWAEVTIFCSSQSSSLLCFYADKNNYVFQLLLGTEEIPEIFRVRAIEIFHLAMPNQTGAGLAGKSLYTDRTSYNSENNAILLNSS